MLLDDLATYLAGQGLGIYGTDLFLTRMPDAPDTCVTLYLYAGEVPQYTQDNATHERPRVQVVTRSKPWRAAQERAQAIFDVLSLANTTIGGTDGYLRVRPLQSPFFLRRDENDRAYWAFNVQVQRA